MKTRMVEAVERGETTPDGAYEHVRKSLADAADDARTRAKEQGYRNPLVAPMFCQTCHYNDNAHPRLECSTGFIPGDPEAVRAANVRLGF